MVANINKLKGKKAEGNITYKTIADTLGMTEVTLRKKLFDDDAEFVISETLVIKDLLKLSNEEYLDIFFGSKLEFNS
jgi:hypothetical protein